MSMKRLLKALVVAVAGALVGLVWAFAIAPAACRVAVPFQEQYARFEAIKTGMSEEEVKKRLGEPDFIHKKGVAPEQYCRFGWTCDKHVIVNHLLVYHPGKPIAYVYFDDSNRVEHVFVGGS